MLATVFFVLGTLFVTVGARCAGSLGGYAVDRSGALQGLQPPVAGTACCALGCLAGEALQVLGYTLLVFGLMLVL